jgi:hypothetical protein
MMEIIRGNDYVASRDWILLRRKTDMAKGKRKKTPSRIKYEQNHPTVSFRVSRELYDRLRAVKEAEGKSITDVLEVGVGLLEVKVGKERNIRQAGYDDGFEKGYKEAQARYMVTYPCKVCRKTLVVTSSKEKEAIKGYMLENGWGHTNCVKRGY